MNERPQDFMLRLRDALTASWDKRTAYLEVEQRGNPPIAAGRFPVSEMLHMKFDWHGGEISRTTAIDVDYRNRQNVRRFLAHECGPHFKFDRELMAWMRNGNAKNTGEVADEWTRSRLGRD
ncbi:DUF6434 domain-containing protein [Janthinobacterium sp. HLS12-2]|uniref:DUF6434 domain-containing protein n=1 Tax=Janthinobacterium sp. HLS12-2 TaxID=1259324 RepID=UPI003F27832F